MPVRVTLWVARLAERDVLDLEVFLDTFATALTAEPRFLHPSERCRDIGDDAPVDADHPGLECAGHPQRTVEVFGVDVRSQTEFGVVGRGDAFVLAVEPDDGCDRPEDLFLQNPRAAGTSANTVGS